MVKHKNVIQLSEIPSEPMKVPKGSSFGGLRQRVGAAIGAKKLGYSFFTVPPGKAAFPFHLHNTNEEMIYILEGEATLRLDKQEIPVSSGTFIACPPGPEHPHQLINTSTHDLRYLVVSTMEYPDISEYPDSNKIGAYVTSAAEGGFRALYRKDTNIPYYDGERGEEIERIKKSAR
ncbi:MAG: cupin domain-containing protein [Deltaproteobacteria bacterium]|nr:cupin domain-containing protein [Deltaproteobacteria bacterium]